MSGGADQSGAPHETRPREYTSWARDQWMFADGGVVILMYHKVAPAPAATNLPALYVTARTLDRQLADLAAARLLFAAGGASSNSNDDSEEPPVG